MSRAIAFDVSVLNITLQPHSPERYVELFEAAFSRRPAISRKYRGKEYMSVKIDWMERFSREEVRAIFGQIQKYTVIDSNSWYDKMTDSKAKDGDEPEYDMQRFSPYYKSFDFVFLPEGHRMYIITKLKQDTLSIAFVAKAMEAILNAGTLSDEFNKVVVNVEYDEASIEKLLSMKKLQKIFIKISLTNDDDVSDIKQKLLDKLKEQNVRTWEQNLIGEKNETIQPDAATTALMELSLSNGYSSVKGERYGKKVVEKTSSYPHIIPEKYYPNEETLFEKLFFIARNTIDYFRTRQNNERVE